MTTSFPIVCKPPTDQQQRLRVESRSGCQGAGYELVAPWPASAHCIRHLPARTMSSWYKNGKRKALGQLALNSSLMVACLRCVTNHIERSRPVSSSGKRHRGAIHRLHKAIYDQRIVPVSLCHFCRTGDMNVCCLCLESTVVATGSLPLDSKIKLPTGFQERSFEQQFRHEQQHAYRLNRRSKSTIFDKL